MSRLCLNAGVIMNRLYLTVELLREDCNIGLLSEDCNVALL